jgi:hypothetical protein
VTCILATQPSPPSLQRRAPSLPARRSKAKTSRAKAKATATPSGRSLGADRGGNEDGDDAEEEESDERDHWGFDSAAVRADWAETSSPPLEMFHWRRVVVDEFTYLRPSDRCATRPAPRCRPAPRS